MRMGWIILALAIRSVADAQLPSGHGRPGDPADAAIRVETVLALLPEAAPLRGEEIFFAKGEFSCANCHQVQGRGHAFGPELTTLGDERRVEEVIRSIVDPNLVIPQEFAAIIVELKDGQQEEGILLQENDESMSLAQPGGNTVQIDRSAIQNVQRPNRSAMPGLGGRLTPRQIADLVVWLMARTHRNRIRAGDPALRMEREDQTAWSFIAEPDHLRLFRGNLMVGIYVFQDADIRHPFFANLHSRSGHPLTRPYPLEGGQDSDHATMHPGLWFAFGDLNGEDFWRNKGSVQHVRFTRSPQMEAGRLTWAVENRLVASDAQTEICREFCQFTVFEDALGIWLMWQAEWVGVDRGLVFGAQEEMGLGVRMASNLRVKGGTGTIRNSEGGRDEKGTWGKAARWWDYGGLVDGIRLGILVVPDPASDRNFWGHTRDYGLMVLNPFPMPGTDETPTRLPQGQRLRMSAAVLLHESSLDGEFDAQTAHGVALEHFKSANR